MPPTIEEPLALELPPGLRAVLAGPPEFARALVVGGCVRDAVLGLPAEDIDVEVHGVSLDELEAALAPFGRTDAVGRSFGVVKLALPEGVVDFSVPRRDSKVAPGHRGFAVEPDPTLSPREAAARRDFTLNALAWDPRRGVVIDHFGGLADLRRRVLRHTSEAFGEDPLRVLRGMQLAARFDLVTAPETLALCRAMCASHAELAVERVWAEWFKWATRAVRPSAGLELLRGCGWLEHVPELSALVGLAQDPRWHPEGDVWTHTLHAVDALARDARWRDAEPATRAAWMFAVLLHDAGKATCTREELRRGELRVVSLGHDVAGGPLARAFLDRIGAPASLVERAVPLVLEHMAHLASPTPRAVRRLAHRLRPESIQSLAVVIAADLAARPPLPADPPAHLAGLLERAEALHVAGAAPRPLLLGRHLVERGWRPSPAFGPLLAAAYDAQLDGAFDDPAGARAWLAAHEADAGLTRAAH